MKDFISAKDRLSGLVEPPAELWKEIIDDVVLTVCCMAMFMYWIAELTYGVTYVN